MHLFVALAFVAKSNKFVRDRGKKYMYIQGCCCDFKLPGIYMQLADGKLNSWE